MRFQYTHINYKISKIPIKEDNFSSSLHISVAPRSQITCGKPTKFPKLKDIKFDFLSESHMTNVY